MARTRASLATEYPPSAKALRAMARHVGETSSPNGSVTGSEFTGYDPLGSRHGNGTADSQHRVSAFRQSSPSHGETCWRDLVTEWFGDGHKVHRVRLIRVKAPIGHCHFTPTINSRYSPRGRSAAHKRPSAATKKKNRKIRLVEQVSMKPWRGRLTGAIQLRSPDST